MTDELGTVRWFGRSWDAPVCDERTHVATPRGEACDECRVPIRLGQEGIGVPGATGGYHWWHLDCWLRMIVGPLADEVLP